MEAMFPDKKNQPEPAAAKDENVNTLIYNFYKSNWIKINFLGNLEGTLAQYK